VNQKIDNPALDKYFWDHTENASDAFKLRRLLEYASFPDLLKIPFDFVKLNLDSIETARLRTSEVRIRFVDRIRGVIEDYENWDEIVFKIAGIQ
jgi:hypothetical protein